MWMGDVAAWATQFRVFAVDIIGDAGLSAPPRPAFDSAAHALWLDDVLDGLSIERASFVGISLGGWLALDYATRRPERVAKLVVLAPAGVGRQKNVLLWALPLLMLGPWGRRRVTQRILGRAPAHPSRAQQAVADFMSLIFKNFRYRTVKLPVFSDEALRRLTMPALAILGGKDALIDSPGVRQRLELNLPQVEIRYLPDTGHAIVNQTAPILDFLRGQQTACGPD
jgi:pimeloyl-ACP methyl ester carboxylesterase